MNVELYPTFINLTIDPELAQLKNDIEFLMSHLTSWEAHHDSDDVQKIAADILKINNELAELKITHPKIYYSSAVQSILQFFNTSLFPGAPTMLQMAEGQQIGQLSSLLQLMNLKGELFSRNGLYGQLILLDNMLKAQ